VLSASRDHLLGAPEALLHGRALVLMWHVAGPLALLLEKRRKTNLMNWTILK